MQDPKEKNLKIAIISDSHGNLANFRRILNWLKIENINIIIHCGDIGSADFLKEALENFEGRFFGVLGNMDRDYKLDINRYQISEKASVKEKIEEVQVGEKKIAFTHFPEAAKSLAESQQYDLVFYGHTHKPWEEKIGKCILANPGETAGQFYKPTFAVYDAGKETLELKILENLSASFQF